MKRILAVALIMGWFFHRNPFKDQSILDGGHMNLIKISMFFLTAILCGCTSKYAITYNSEPKGASVICNGTNVGYAPKTLYYEIKERNKQSGTMNPVPCYAVWSTGIREEYPRQYSMTQFPNGVIITAKRPYTEGYQQDAEFALKIQQLEYQKKQAEAAKSAAFQESLQNYRTKTCFTNYGVTTCY